MELPMDLKLLKEKNSKIKQKSLPNNVSFDLAMKIYADRSHPSAQSDYNAMLKSLCEIKKPL
jgi:hypothetical protein